MTPGEAFLSQMLQSNDVYFSANPKRWWFQGKELAVFTIIDSLISDGVEANLGTVGQKFDAGYVSMLTSLPVTAANWRFFADQVKRNGTAAELRKMAQKVEEDVKTIEPTEVIDYVTDIVDGIVSGTDEYRIMTAKELSLKLAEVIEQRYNLRGTIPGIDTAQEQAVSRECHQAQLIRRQSTGRHRKSHRVRWPNPR